MTHPQPNWLNELFRLRGNIASIALPRALFFSVIAVGVAIFYHYSPQLPWKFCQYLINNVAFNLILGLLLVFRTNTAYERFWEGHKAWSEILGNIRSLLREMESAVTSKALTIDAKKQVMTWSIALAIATKSHLRQKKENKQLQSLLTAEEYQKSLDSSHIPLLILQWLENFACLQLEINSRLTFRERLATLTRSMTACEGLLNTPIPFAYTIFLRQLILIYCFFLPFGLVETLAWGTVPITLIVSFVLLGVEAIAAEIEDPFGQDENDLPLDELCQTLCIELKEFGIVTPSENSALV